MAAVELLRRGGETEFQLRFSDEMDPTLWIAMVPLAENYWEVAAALTAEEAVFLLCRNLFSASACTHCDKLMMFEPSELEFEMFPDRCAITWSPALGRYIGCGW